MEAKQGVLEHLNKILTGELTAVHQYVAHAAMCENWGYERLHHALQERAHDELDHARSLVEHILYLDGTPDLQTVNPLTIGQTVPEQFQHDLVLEMEVLTLLRAAIAHCTQVGDFTTRHKLEDLCVETEEHIDWLETQQETIKQVGLENYLSEQIKK
ncbi:MAG: bacterioferritin [Nitrospirae bacterium]|nr:MAG: bacterioferritin [Nitrospirota bacterium]